MSSVEAVGFPESGHVMVTKRLSKEHVNELR